MLEVQKQGLNNDKLWVIGKLDLGIMCIEDLFNTNLNKELDDTSKPIKIKKVKISRVFSKKSNSYEIRYFLEF